MDEGMEKVMKSGKATVQEFGNERVHRFSCVNLDVLQKTNQTKTCQDVYTYRQNLSHFTPSHLTNLPFAALVSLVLSLPSAALPASDALPLLLPLPLSVWSPQPLLAAAVALLLLFVLLREGGKEGGREGGREDGRKRKEEKNVSERVERRG